MGLINDAIRLRRVELGLTQTEVAKRLGIAPQAYSRYENSDMVPLADRLYQIASVLGVSLESLISPENVITGSSPTAIDRLIVECARLGLKCEPVYTAAARLTGYNISGPKGSRFMSMQDVSRYQEALNGYSEDYLDLFIIGGVKGD